MSYSNALKTVDFLLNVLNEADKPAPQSEQNAPVAQIKAVVDTSSEVYFDGVEDEAIKENNHIQVTMNSARFAAMWKESELGLNDEKDIYLGTVGKIMEVEEDDDTVQLRWANYDTCWIPVKACIIAKEQVATLPKGNIGHLG